MYSPVDVEKVIVDNVKTLEMPEQFECAKSILALSEYRDYLLSQDLIEELEKTNKESLICKVEISDFEYGLTRIKAPNEDDISPVIRKNTNIDKMEGHEFEEYCANLLECNGFINVIVTQGSGDHGIDILAEKDDVSYAIQCKCYSSNIGNAAIQQALAGKKYYKRDIAVVLTNQYFTSQAKDEAKVFGVKLWDRDKLNDLIEKSNL